jgi:hypothetical protein
MFNEVSKAIKVAKTLGANIDLPDDIALSKRQIKLSYNKDGRLIVDLELGSTDQESELPKWVKSGKKWTQIVNAKAPPKHETEVANYDDVVRHIVDVDNNDCGWVINSDSQWRNEPLTHVNKFLLTFGLDDKEIATVIGNSIAKCWMLVNKPFQPEYPGDRQWNRHSPQFKFPPADYLDNPNCPTWNKILNHCGESISPFVAEHPWCKANGIKTGGDYLKCWIASIFQFPEEPLPYLFFYGPQNSGKSIFHEAFELLVTSGVVRADHALTDPTFNGELESAILCVIEETNVNDKKSKTVYNRIKDWVTSRYLFVRKLYQTPFSVVNTTHWAQFSNEKDNVPIFPGDSRITMIYVGALQEIIPKRELIRLLQKEGPDFLSSVLTLELPECRDRLNVPVIETPDKAEMQDTHRSPLDMFIMNMCYYCPGKSTLFSHFYNAFIDSVDPLDIDNWSKIRVGKELDNQKYPKGRRNTSDMEIGNLSLLAPSPEELNRPKLVLGPKGKLIQELTK